MRPFGRHHHPARRVFEHEVDRIAEDASPPSRPRRAHHDDLARAPFRLVDDRATCAARPHDPLRHPDAVELGDRSCCVQCRIGLRLLCLEWCLQRQVERNDDD